MHLLFGWLTRTILGLILMALSTVLSSAAARVAPARYLLTGQLAGEQVQLELTLSPTEVTGKLLGTSPQTLIGQQTQNGEIRLEGAGLNFTGRLPERFSEDRTFSGTLRNGTPFNLTLAASYTVRRTTQGPFLETRTETPFWLVAPWERLNGRLGEFVNAPVASFVRDAQQVAVNSDFFYPYSYESVLEPTLLTDDTLSLLETTFYYTGGAHPNTSYRSLNFYRTGEEKPVRLGLKDLFLEGAAYRAFLLREINRKLRARRAAWILDGTVKLTEKDLGVFILTGRGLEFTFTPYAVGPYAQGKFAVTLPYEKLRGLLKPGLLP